MLKLKSIMWKFIQMNFLFLSISSSPILIKVVKNHNIKISCLRESTNKMIFQETLNNVLRREVIHEGFSKPVIQELRFLYSIQSIYLYNIIYILYCTLLSEDMLKC